MWQCNNAKKARFCEKIFGWQSKLPQKCPASLMLLIRFQEFSCHTWGVYRSFCFVCLYFTIIQGTNMSSSHHTVCIKRSICSKEFWVPQHDCLPLFCRHNLFWAATMSCSIYYFIVTMVSSVKVAAISAFLHIYVHGHISLFLPLFHFCEVWWGKFHLSTEVSLRL